MPKKGSKPANYKYNVPTKQGRGGISLKGMSTNKVEALTNPFHDAARGTRIPDDDSAPSVPVTLRSTFTVGTSAAGETAFTIAPVIIDCFRSASTMSGPTVTTWGSGFAMNDYAATAAAFSKYRIVSLGVRVFPITRPTEQGGAIRIITTPEKLPNGVILDGGFWETVNNVAVSQADVHWIAKPQGTTWKEYVDIDSLAANYNNLAVLIYGAQGSVTNAFSVEVTFNLECLVELGSVVGSLAKPGRASDPKLLQTASVVHSKHHGVHTDGAPSMFQRLGSFAREALLDVASSAIPFIGSSVANMFRQKPAKNQRYKIVD